MSHIPPPPTHTHLYAQPLSLEEMMAKREEEAKAQAKVNPHALLDDASVQASTFPLQPVFLSKEERVALALKRRQEQVEAQQQREQEERGARLRYLENAQHSSRDRRWESSEQVKILT